MLDNFYQGEGGLEVLSVQSVPINTNCCYIKLRGCVGRVTTCVCVGGDDASPSSVHSRGTRGAHARR